MRLLFCNPEQYVDWQEEPSNYELRLPVLHCGLEITCQDYVPRQVLRAAGAAAMHTQAIALAEAFRPDLVISSMGHVALSLETLRELMQRGFPVVLHLWDPLPPGDEPPLFQSCTYLCIADSVSAYRRHLGQLGTSSSLRGILYCGGNNVFTDVIRPHPVEKRYDVTLVGSNEGDRVGFLDYLRTVLVAKGIGFHKCGGLVDSTKGGPDAGLTDAWLPWPAYVEAINASRICLSSPTEPTRSQIKGKVFHYLAAGALCLVEENQEVRALIPPECLVCYEGQEHCLAQIEYYLAHPEEAARIAANGFAWFHRTFNYRQFWRTFLLAAVRGDRIAPESEWRWGRSVL